MELLGYIAALFMGLIMGLVGGGGSILTVPILVYFFGQNAINATTGSLLIVGIGAMTGAFIHIKKGYIDFKVGIQFALPGMFGVIFGRQILLPLLPSEINLIEGISITKTSFVLMVFAVIMIVASLSLFKPVSTQVVARPQLLKFFLQGFLVGCLTGFVGAGGGFLIVPALIVFARLPLKIAVGTSLVIMTINSFFGFYLSLPLETVQLPLLLKVAAIGVLGLLLGIQFSKQINEAHLKKGFALLTLSIGTFVLIQQFLFL